MPTTEKDLNVINEMLPIALSPNLVLLAQQRDAMKERHAKEDEVSHKEFWEALHEQYPLLNQDKGYSVDNTYLSAGIAMLKASKCNHGKDGMPDDLKELLASLISKKLSK